MAQRAETLNLQTAHARMAPVVPLRVEEMPTQRGVFKQTMSRAEAVYRSTRSRLAEIYSELAQQSEALTTALGRRVRTARSERPLEVVAVAAGTAFLVGIALRMWRSRYE